MSLTDFSASLNESLGGSWAGFIADLSDWQGFYTLTFDTSDRTHDVTRDEARFMWRRLVQVLNRNLFGNNYTRIVHHSYFGYVVAYEYQTRGVLHMHALVDEVTNWELVNSAWRMMCGIAKVKKVTDKLFAGSYLAKYVTKGGDLDLYIPKVRKVPSFKPLWWMYAKGEIKMPSRPKIAPVTEKAPAVKKESGSPWIQDELTI